MKKLLLLLSILTFSLGAFAAADLCDQERNTDPTKEDANGCTDAQVWDDNAKKCVAKSSSAGSTVDP